MVAFDLPSMEEYDDDAAEVKNIINEMLVK
jgi:hypothetical protein